MILFKKSVFFLLVCAIIANSSLGIFERKTSLSLKEELLSTIIIQLAHAMTEEERIRSEVGLEPGKKIALEGTTEGTTDWGAIGSGAGLGAGIGGMIGGTEGAVIGAVAGGALTAVACAPGVIAGAAYGLVASPWCQIVQVAQQIFSEIGNALRAAGVKIDASLRDIIAKRILDYIVNETIKWIQGGGEPKFVGNWEGFLRDVGDIAFDSVIKDVGLARLCSPFGLQAKMMLLPELNFRQRIDCTLDQVVSNIENFYVDFSVGGWQAYNELWKPNNNFYGFVLTTNDEMLRRISEKKEAAKNEAIAGAGFMGDKICKAGSNLSNDIEIAVEQDCVEFTGYPAGSDEYNLCAESRRNYYIKTSDLAKGRNNEICDPKNLVDANPGSLVGKAVGEAITTDKEWAANIQSWTSALVNAIINRVIREGVKEMKSVTGGDYGSKASSYYPSEYQGAAKQTFQMSHETIKQEIRKFGSEWLYILNSKRKSLTAANELLPILTEIESKNCPKTISLIDPLSDLVLGSGEQISISLTASSTRDIINRLQSGISNLEKEIIEAESMIKMISEAPEDATEGNIAVKRAEIDYNVNVYMNRHNTIGFQRQIVDGSARQAADQEAQNLQNESEAAKMILSVCVPPAQPAQPAQP